MQEEAAIKKSEVNSCYFPGFIASTLNLKCQ